MMQKPRGPKILVLDIETAPLEVYTWGLFDQNIGLNQVIKDWSILSWSAKWFNPADSTTMYEDNRGATNVRDDKKLLKSIRNLMDEADIILTQNGNKFDIPKLNARFILNKLKPPSSYKRIDTCEIARRKFGFTSNKLEYLTDKLCIRYKKLKHDKFPGFDMWRECLAGNQAAWKEMEKYNKYDVLALEELYTVIRPWDGTINFNVYSDSLIGKCSCGSKSMKKNGFFYTSIGKYQRYKCLVCGSEAKDRNNLFSKEKKKSLKGVIR